MEHYKSSGLPDKSAANTSQGRRRGKNFGRGLDTLISRYAYGAFSVTLLLVLLGFKSGADPDPRPASTASFCDERVAHDYAKPFELMPAVRGIPSSGHLPFSPRALEVDTPSSAILVPGEALSMSYGLSVPSEERLGRRLAWGVSSQLIQVNATGRRLQVVERTGLRFNTRDVKDVSGLGYSLEVSPRPAFYLVATQFRTLNGTNLGEYGEYFRVVRPTHVTKLVASQQSVRVGEQLVFRIENSGTRSVSFGEPFGVEKEVNGSWLPVGLPLGPWHAQRLGLGAGEVGACQELVVPSRLRPGGYRVRKDLLDPPRHLEVGFVVAP